MGCFDDAENVTELVHLIVGAGSMCWVGGTGAAEFDTEQALAVADDGINRLIELGWAPSERE
jgi:hypothetical protein